ncbi:reverse transcriptase domain-containing protein [Tanacetum coccineum]
MANTTPIVTTVTKTTTKEKAPKETDAAPKVNIQDFCEEHYEDILPVIKDKVRRDKRKEVHTRLDFGDNTKRSRRTRELFEAAFQLLKQKLCSAPILALPECSENFVVYCDASCKGLGAVLMQKEKVIAYASCQLQDQKELNMRQRRWLDLLSVRLRDSLSLEEGKRSGECIEPKGTN